MLWNSLTHFTRHELLLGTTATSTAFGPAIVHKGQKLLLTDLPIIVGVQAVEKISHVLLGKVSDAALKEMTQLMHTDSTRLVVIKKVE